MRATERFIILCWAVFFVFWTISAFSTKPTLERQPLPKRVAPLFLVLLALVFLNLKFHWVLLRRRVLPPLPGLDVVAAVLAFLGLQIALWARVSIGRNWSARVTLKVGHELIQHGPYRWVRHPIYSGLLLMALGSVLCSNEINAFLGLAIGIAAVWVKLRSEEALMTKRFPEAYPQYKARTKALIPFLL